MSLQRSGVSHSVFVVAIIVAVGVFGAAGRANGQSLQYRSTAGVEYRSQPDTGAIARAEQALAADPRNVQRFVDLGVAQSGARQFREAIETFTRGLAVSPDNALLLRWRGHRYLSVREFDRAPASWYGHFTRFRSREKWGTRPGRKMHGRMARGRTFGRS